MKLCGKIWHIQRGHYINIIRRMRTANLVTTDIYSEYVILVAFTLHQWLQDCASVFCYITLLRLLKLFLRMLLLVRNLLYSVTHTMLVP